jgi:hypothetical protein
MQDEYFAVSESKIVVVRNYIKNHIILKKTWQQEYDELINMDL